MPTNTEEMQQQFILKLSFFAEEKDLSSISHLLFHFSFVNGFDPSERTHLYNHLGNYTNKKNVMSRMCLKKKKELQNTLL